MHIHKNALVNPQTWIIPLSSAFNFFLILYTKNMKYIRTYEIESFVDTWNKDDQWMETATWSKEQEVHKVGMVKMSTTSVNPWTMMIHLHNTSETKARISSYNTHIKTMPYTYNKKCNQMTSLFCYWWFFEVT